jgi:hypothetical protein
MWVLWVSFSQCVRAHRRIRAHAPGAANRVKQTHKTHITDMADLPPRSWRAPNSVAEIPIHHGVPIDRKFLNAALPLVDRALR